MVTNHHWRGTPGRKRCDCFSALDCLFALLSRAALGSVATFHHGPRRYARLCGNPLDTIVKKLILEIGQTI